MFPGYSLGKCAISRLDNYLNGGHPFLGNEFPNLLSEMELDDRFNRVIKRMDYLLADYNVIYIASQNQKLALWAEFFAKKLSAKHLCFFTTEEYRGPNTYFEEYMDFYKYKFMRNELFALNVKKLFEGYINIDNPDLYKPSFIEIEAVQDCHDERIERIQKKEWNIAYIGRSEKKYVPAIIRELSIFAQRHNDKSILFIMVGDAKCRLEVLNKYLLSLPNVQVLLLGNMVPIPRELFKKLDVVIAGSGSAVRASWENVPTIVVDSEKCMSNGILGYTCFKEDVIFCREGKKQYTIRESLEDVLVYKTFLENDYKPVEYKNPWDYYKRFLDCFLSSPTDYQYYTFNNGSEECSFGLHGDDVDKFMHRFKQHKDQIVVFGAGRRGVDCYYFLKSMNEEIAFYIDNDSNKWYGECCGCIVLPVEIMREKEDRIIIIANDCFKKEMWDQLQSMDILDGSNCITFDLFSDHMND